MRSALAGIALLALTACENAPRDVAPNPMLPTLAIASATPNDNAEIISTRQTIEFAGELTQGGWIRGQVPLGTDLAMLGDTELSVDHDGSFFAAFDRDASGSSTLRVTLEDGRVIDRPIDVAPRAWSIEQVNVAKRNGGSSEAWWKKREPEWLAIKAAREKATGATGWQQDFIWPVKGRISGRFGSQRIYRGEPGSYHSGLDIAPGAGTPFVAPADGVVVLAADNFSLEGNLLIIDHGQGLNSAFLHASRLMVSEGDHVEQGQHIGDVGSSGRATGPHLHWSLKWRDARLDPLLFVDPDA
ncbi:M23 family metallopeptidase [Altererythrobacter ishigakiensis]|uniref:Murein DD-endopeptidase MepM/ murein hydrolase activator NlpD n=1 Tax=Altererythrobacter ishigakiensis TaxID=476157 RepID=A0A562UT06_9SPHN|nr:murein DD-endopeptidase MepM/ murein hydrolase activator NlpD [Altererythrobacter ishigakiensis]